jgi:hypothetical protein
MAIDITFLNELLALPDLASRDTFVVGGVEFQLPLSSPRGPKRVRDWQRRVLPDLIPDSVNADAPERTPFRILYALTTGQKARQGIEEALGGDLAPLESLFRAVTETSRKKMTLAFHVLAVKAASIGEPDTKGFTERTFLLLCRREDGQLDHELVGRLIEQFRMAPEKLDLAQRTLLDRIEPGWRPDHEPRFDPGSAADPVVPFDPEACRLFQQDLRSLLDAGMSAPDFFQNLNLLLILHLGLFQTRAATILNPQIDHLEADLAAPSVEHLKRLRLAMDRDVGRHPFTGFLACRAADDSRTRRVSPQNPALLSVERADLALQRFHFSVLTFVQLRRLAEAYLANKWDNAKEYLAESLSPSVRADLLAEVRTPLKFIERLHTDVDFRPFLEKALTVLCVRFVHNQIPDTDRERALEAVRHAASPLEGLRRLYERYNTQSSRNATASRSYRQGTQVMSSLLGQGEYGLLQSRRGVGKYFEIGAGLLPLLLLLAVTPQKEKIPLDQLWTRLEQYGLALDADERVRLLERLRAMGVYERYSDAGDSAYVRNLMIGTSAT